MPIPRRATKACQTDYDMYEMRPSELEKHTEKLSCEIADLKSNREEPDVKHIENKASEIINSEMLEYHNRVKEVEGKIESLSTQTDNKFEIAHI